MAPSGRSAVAFVVLAVLLDAVSFGIIIPVMPALIVEITGEEIGRAATYGGWLLFSFAFVQFLAAPLVGGLSDRFGRRPVLLLSMLMFGVDYLIMGLSPTLALLFVGRMLAGIPGASYTTAYAYLADVSAPDSRAKNFGLVGAAFGVGFIVGPAIGGLLGTFGTRAPFFAAAAFAFANLALGSFALRESLPAADRRPFSWRRANPLGSLLQLRRYPQVTGLAAVLFLWALAGQVYPSTWSFYTIQRFGWTEAIVGASLAFVGVIMIVSQGLLPGPLVRRLGERRATLLGLAAGSAGFAGFALATEGWMLFAVLLTWFLAGIVMPGLNASMSKGVPRDGQGELQGANASLFSLASILGPPLMTQLFGAFARPDAPVALPGAAFLAASLLTAVGAVVFVRAAAAARRVEPSPTAPPSEAAVPR